MKKTLKIMVGLLVSGVGVSQANYVALINDNSAYTVKESVSVSYGDWSPWSDSGSSYDCETWSPDASTQPYAVTDGETFTQNRNCSQDQTRIRSVYDSYTDGTKVEKGTDIEEQTISVSESQLENKLVSDVYCLTLEELKTMIDNNEDVTNVCTSKITSMFGLFFRKVDFNQDISGWDVRNVTDMSYMFSFTFSFNQDLSGWDVSNVTDMSYMFSYAYIYNQPLNNWDVSNVTNMNTMFYEAKKYNQPLNNWEVSNVTNMNTMFFGALQFNQDISGWDVSNVTESESFDYKTPIEGTAYSPF